MIGDYFVTDINKEVYCFKIDSRRIKVWQKTLTKSFRKLHYTTNHFMPISPEDVTELEQVIRENGLPKMNIMLFNVLRTLGKTEKKVFTPHILQELVDKVSQKKEKYQELAINLINYLEHLNIDKVITPVRHITDFIEEDLIATDPKFLGSIVSSYQRTDVEHKKITNTPIGAKTAWLKWIAILCIVLLIGAIAWILYDSKALNSMIPNFSPPVKEPDIMAKYGSPEALKAAIDRGEVKYETLPPNIQKMIDTVETPAVTVTP